MTTGAARVAAVTGASRGIGSAIAAELAARGFRVACLSRKGAGPEDRALPAEHRALTADFVCDVTDEASIRSALAATVERFGRLDVLVNNAGQHADGRSASFASADFEALLAANVTSVFAMSREAYPHLKATRGLIVNLGSYYDKLGVKYHAAYCASKAAVAAVGRCLAVEWAKDGIRVVTVAPGFIGTDLNKRHMEHAGFREYITKRIPSGEIGTPEEVARLIAGLAVENLAFLSGETIYLDGAQAVAH
jgi:NAD(P)-dependent dehydrogenase (short-subunit alcohol dehydrogenase family)